MEGFSNGFPLSTGFVSDASGGMAPREWQTQEKKVYLRTGFSSAATCVPFKQGDHLTEDESKPLGVKAAQATPVHWIVIELR